MKQIVIGFLLLVSFLGFGQSVSAPDPKSFTVNTAGQDASGFLLNGFTTTDILLASISLVSPPANTTFYLSNTAGLTAASGFTLSGNKTRLVVTGTMSNINNALASLKVNTGTVTGAVNISVAATINPSGYYYNGVNGHFYKPVSTGAYYPTAKLNAHASTFKGQEGYLVTLTSANEEDFIKANVPQSNIWFAATDKVTDGTWVIDDGPELGTVMKTSNGQTAGNIPGVYNNWCAGEPNGSNHSEDYPVAKWNGAACWNDLNPNYFNPYVIEYGTWTNPDNQTFTDFYNNSVSHSNGEILRLQMGLKFGNSADKTKFPIKVSSYSNNTYSNTTNTSRIPSGLGRVDITSDLDTARVVVGYKASITGGAVEYAYCEPNLYGNGSSRLLIDMRTFGNVSPSTVSLIDLLGLYVGPVEYITQDGAWAHYKVLNNLTAITTSSNQNIRNAGYGGWAFACNLTFAQNRQYKPHRFKFESWTPSTLQSLYNQIISVSDVYLVFKEVSDNGLFGDQFGSGLTSGPQYMNADVDGNGVVNEQDSFLMLQHLTGTSQLLNSTVGLSSIMKILPTDMYDGITATNWTSYDNSTRDSYGDISLNTGILNMFNEYSIFWKGDVNMSHSAAQTTSVLTTNSIRTMNSTTTISNTINADLVGETIGGKLVVTITVNPLQQELVGTQFQLNYDNTALKFEKVEFKTKGSPTNYGVDKETYVTVGSLITDGSSSLDNTTEYKVIFTPLSVLSDTLGLTSISLTDAVSRNGTQLKVIMN